MLILIYSEAFFGQPASYSVRISADCVETVWMMRPHQLESAGVRCIQVVQAEHGIKQAHSKNIEPAGLLPPPSTRQMVADLFRFFGLLCVTSRPEPACRA